MALRNIVQDGDPVLKKVCRPVTKFDKRLAQLVDDMGETMLEGNGVGLAAPQVGVLRRVFVALDESDLPEEPTQEELESYQPKVREFINPEIIETSGEQRGYEGCLSFPGRYGAISRPDHVIIRAQDKNGDEFTFEGTGMMARCLCHESNHLDGVTIDDLAEYFYDPEVPHDLDEIEDEEAEAEELELAEGEEQAEE